MIAQRRADAQASARKTLSKKELNLARGGVQVAPHRKYPKPAPEAMIQAGWFTKPRTVRVEEANHAASERTRKAIEFGRRYQQIVEEQKAAEAARLRGRAPLDLKHIRSARAVHPQYGWLADATGGDKAKEKERREAVAKLAQEL